MILDIAKQEFRGIIREGRFRTAAFLLSALFVLSLLGAFDYYANLKQQHEEAARVARGQWEGQGDKNPHSAAHYGTYVFKPVYPLSYFDRGVDAFTGNTLFLEGHRSNLPVFRAADEQGDFARLGALTPAFVLGILMPLFIIVLGFGSAAAERENGNLRLLFAQGVRPSSLFFGKSLGIWSAGMLLALPFFLAGAAGLLVTDADAGYWGRYLGMVFLYLLYFASFIHLVLLVSAWAGRQNAALVGSLGVWVLACLIVPKAAVHLAEQRFPAPTWQVYHDGIREDLENGVDGHDATDAFTKRLEAEMLAKYGVDSVQQLPFNWSGFIMQKGEEHETYVFQKHKSRLLEVYQHQRQFQAAAAVFSPFVLANLISRRLAGTDVEVYFDFLAAAEKYRVQLVGELNKDLTENFKYGDWSGTRGSEFFAQNARFEYRPPELSSLLAGLVAPMGFMLAWALLSGIAAFFFFKKLKPV